jgi:hypothetical protein
VAVPVGGLAERVARVVEGEHAAGGVVARGGEERVAGRRGDALAEGLGDGARVRPRERGQRVGRGRGAEGRGGGLRGAP